MARGIITCTGEQINIGDKVRTADGKVIKVTGAAIGVTFHNAETCTHVPPNTRTTAEESAGKKDVEPESASRARASDCIIWGT